MTSSVASVSALFYIGLRVERSQEKPGEPRNVLCNLRPSSGGGLRLFTILELWHLFRWPFVGSPSRFSGRTVTRHLWSAWSARFSFPLWVFNKYSPPAPVCAKLMCAQVFICYLTPRWPLDLGPPSGPLYTLTTIDDGTLELNSSKLNNYLNCLFLFCSAQAYRYRRYRMASGYLVISGEATPSPISSVIRSPRTRRNWWANKTIRYAPLWGSLKLAHFAGLSVSSLEWLLCRWTLLIFGKLGIWFLRNVFCWRKEVKNNSSREGQGLKFFGNTIFFIKSFIMESLQNVLKYFLW